MYLFRAEVAVAVRRFGCACAPTVIRGDRNLPVLEVRSKERVRDASRGLRWTPGRRQMPMPRLPGQGPRRPRVISVGRPTISSRATSTVRLPGTRPSVRLIDAGIPSRLIAARPGTPAARPPPGVHDATRIRTARRPLGRPGGRAGRRTAQSLCSAPSISIAANRSSSSSPTGPGRESSCSTWRRSGTACARPSARPV